MNFFKWLNNIFKGKERCPVCDSYLDLKECNQTIRQAKPDFYKQIEEKTYICRGCNREYVEHKEVKE